ncbi:DNA-packaging protein [Planctomycetales bacterium]|nr:DNA-packaging protein [Planctomycetales bacterium]
MSISLTPKQNEAAYLLGGTAANVLLFGGSRSGKTFIVCWRLAHNAVACPQSRQAIVRKYLNTVRTAVGLDTMPKVLDALKIPYHFNKHDNYFEFHNGSQIWLIGQDDNNRAERILGKEFFTMYFNECSEMSWQAVQFARTRNSQKVVDYQNKERRNRLYFDCNPPSKRHWSYRAFVGKKDPVKNTSWDNQANWVSMQLNPADNEVFLGKDYITETLGSFSGNLRRRFLDGQFTDDNENALWQRPLIDRHRVDSLPFDMEKIVVAVDPSGGAGPANCEAGIIVAGSKFIGSEQHFYVLDDRTILGMPEVWAGAAVRAYEEYQADCIVAETNFGGAMVEQTIKSVGGGRACGYAGVVASRSKIIRAEPVRTQYARGLVHHCGEFSLLEDEMCSYTGAVNDASPNRLDALVWAITYLKDGGAAALITGNYDVF